MPTLIFTATGRRHDGVIDLTVELPDGRTLTRTVTASKINTPEKLAAWLLEQEPDRGEADATLQRTFTATFHVEQRVDPADGRSYPVRVVDSVTAAAMPEDAALDRLAGTPLATITLAEALAAVDAADTLPKLRAVVRGLVQVVIPMRDVVRRLVQLRRP